MSQNIPRKERKSFSNNTCACPANYNEQFAKEFISPRGTLYTTQNGTGHFIITAAEPSWELFKTPTNSLESQFTCSAIESAKDRPIHFFFFTLPFEREGNTIYPRQESHQKKSLRLLLWELKSWLVCLINVPIFRQSQRLKNKPQNVIYPSFLSGIHWILRICLLLFENEFSKGFLMFP